jgi:hypothetical protein
LGGVILFGSTTPYCSFPAKREGTSKQKRNVVLCKCFQVSRFEVL